MIQKIVTLLILQLVVLSSCKSQNNIMETNHSLHYIIRESKDSTIKSPLLILLHGYGSNEYDLFSLHKNIPDNWIVVSVRGPYKLNEGSYRWYDVKMVNDKIIINIEEEENSRKKLIKLIAELANIYNVDTKKIIVAGFSQGANMAQCLGLSEPSIISGFGVFSGRFVDEFSPYISIHDELKNTMAFISHGTSDNMLPKNYADENISKLKNLGIQVTFCEDSNGHSISIKQWDEFSKWLSNLK